MNNNDKINTVADASLCEALALFAELTDEQKIVTLDYMASLRLKSAG